MTDLIERLGGAAFDLCRCGAWRFLHRDGAGPCLICQMVAPPDQGCRAFELATPAAEVAREDVWGLVAALLRGLPVPAVAALIALAMVEDGERA